MKRILLVVLCALVFVVPVLSQEYEMPTLSDIKAELLQDPNGYGYAQYLGDNFNPPVLAEMINLRRAEIVMPRPDVTPLEILEAISLADFLTDKTSLWSAWFESLTQFPSVRILKDNGTDTRVMTNIMRLLANGSASETRIRALAVRSGSRAEQLWGAGITISVEDVINAVRS